MCPSLSSECVPPCRPLFFQNRQLHSEVKNRIEALTRVDATSIVHLAGCSRRKVSVADAIYPDGKRSQGGLGSKPVYQADHRLPRADGDSQPAPVYRQCGKAGVRSLIETDLTISALYEGNPTRSSDPDPIVIPCLLLRGSNGW